MASPKLAYILTSLFGLSLFRHVKLYSDAAAVSNISMTAHRVTFDPNASWLKFHLGINRYALYSRDDSAIPRLLKEMQSMTVIGAGDPRRDLNERLYTGMLEVCSPPAPISEEVSLQK